MGQRRVKVDNKSLDYISYFSVKQNFIEPFYVSFSVVF